MVPCHPFIPLYSYSRFYTIAGFHRLTDTRTRTQTALKEMIRNIVTHIRVRANRVKYLNTGQIASRQRFTFVIFFRRQTRYLRYR